jgi:UDP-glucuronate 4-epimerase
MGGSVRVFLTGAAGFIGYHTAVRLLRAGHKVMGFDSINDYYDVRLKYARLDELRKMQGFDFIKGDLIDPAALRKAYEGFGPDHVIHLAAQAGVRYSIENPKAYIDSNVVGFQNMIELVREHRPQNFLYASSSSVYGGNKKLPFSEADDTSNPISLYAATKMSNELVAKCYSHLYEIPSVGLRFFTVYGPIARPDMAIFKFAELMRQGKKIPVYNQGKMIRDWTFVDDIVDGILASLAKPERGEVYNLGKGMPDMLSDMIGLLEEYLGMKAQMELLPMQMGDVEATHADVSKAHRSFGYQPKVSLKVGLAKFCDWYLSCHN